MIQQILIRRPMSLSTNKLVRLYNLNKIHLLEKSLIYTNKFDLATKQDVNSIVFAHSFHTHSQVLYKDPESKAEKTANLLKSEAEDAQKPAEKTQVSKVVEKTLDKASLAIKESSEEQKRLTLGQRVMKELRHYYNGFKLLYFETKIAFRLLKSVLNGHTLTRRERKQFIRTAADLFRLVPFSVFIIVPFLEFTLPIFLKLFPNMLPSTFKEESKEQENLKKRLKAKLEMAKFLQDTLEETALKSNDNNSSETTLNQKFAEFMKKVRTKGEQPTSEEIMKFSSLFENELTLDNLNRNLLIALCQILDISTYGNIPPNHILRFQLRMKIRSLEADDQMILSEGIDNLTVDELQQACRERGMRALGVSENRLRNQLQQWLDLHLNQKIPLSLLLLSRALYLPENLAPEDLIKSTISSLPKSIETATIAKIAESSGGKVDNEIKLELLKQEEKEIKLEKSTEPEKLVDKAKVPIHAADTLAAKEAIQAATSKEQDFAAQQLEKEKLVDTAKVIGEEVISSKEIKEINELIESSPLAKEKQVKTEIEELKKDVSEYVEDIKEVEQLSLKENQAKLTESKSAKILGKRVQKLLSDIDKLVDKLEKQVPEQEKLSSTKNSVSIDELVETIKKIRGVSNDVKEKRLLKILTSLDMDKDGKIDDLNDVLKVFDLIEQENVNITKTQLGRILNVLEKEKQIESQEQEQLKAKEAPVEDNSAKKSS